MLGDVLGDPGADAVVLGAAITMVGSVAAAWLAYRNGRAIKTRNGDSPGAILDLLRDATFRHELRMDAIEVELRESRQDIREVADATATNRVQAARLRFDLSRHETTYQHDRELIDEDPAD